MYVYIVNDHQSFPGTKNTSIKIPLEKMIKPTALNVK